MKKVINLLFVLVCALFILGCENGSTPSTPSITPQTLLAKLPLSAQELAQGQARTAVTNTDLAAENDMRYPDLDTSPGQGVMLYLCLMKNDIAASKNFEFNTNVAVGRIQSVSNETKANMRSIGVEEAIVTSMDSIFRKIDMGTVFFSYDSNKFTLFWNVPQQTITINGQNQVNPAFSMYIEGNMVNDNFSNCRFVGVDSSRTEHLYIYMENDKVIEETSWGNEKGRTVCENGTMKYYTSGADRLYAGYRDSSRIVTYQKDIDDNNEYYNCCDANGYLFCNASKMGSNNYWSQEFPLKFLTVAENSVLDHTVSGGGVEDWMLDQINVDILKRNVTGLQNFSYYVFYRTVANNKKDTSALAGGKLMCSKMNDLTTCIDTIDETIESLQADSNYTNVTTAKTQEYVTIINNWVASL